MSVTSVSGGERFAGMTDIGTLSEFTSGEIALRVVHGREVAVIRWDDEIFVIGNSCPHQGGSFCRGHLGPLITGKCDGELTHDRDRLMIGCGWHGWEFDLRTGSCLWDESVHVRLYRVEIVEGRVLVGSKGSRSARRARAELGR